MKDEDLFSKDGPPPAASDQQRSDSEHRALSSAHPVSQDAPASAHPWRLLLVALVVLVVLAGGYGVFRAVSPSSRQETSAFQQVTPCPFRLSAGLLEAKSVRCGWLSVPEDWSQPQGSTIRLAVAIFKTSSPHPAPDPVLILGGGPGQALLQTVGPIRLLNRDLILLDQRGAGYSQPSLRCLDNETPQACHSRLVKSGINLNAFTTLQNAADVHALIRALGYQQVNLDGISYGTRLALTFMREARQGAFDSDWAFHPRPFGSCPLLANQ